MNEHAGPACALSVLIVGLFAVLLHDRDHPPAPQANPGHPTPTRLPDSLDPPKLGPGGTRPRPEFQIAAPTSAPTLPAVAEPAPVVAPVVVAKPADPPRSPNEPAAPQITSTSPKPLPVPIARSRPSLPRSAFTVVLAGEKLRDVATRVYGSADSTEELWRANRDQLTQVDSAITRGTLLRTP